MLHVRIKTLVDPSCCTPLPTVTHCPSRGRAGGTPQPLLLLYLLQVFLLQSRWGMWSFPSLAGDVLVYVLLAATSVTAAVMMGRWHFPALAGDVLVDVSLAVGINAAVELLLDLRNTSFEICNKRSLCFS